MKSSTLNIVIWGIAAALLVAILWVRAQTDRVKQENKMKDVAVGYLQFLTKHGRPPEKQTEVTEYMLTPEGKTHMEDGSVVFIYGVDRLDMLQLEGPHRTVIAYETDAPQNGGLVVFGDGHISEVTAAEFANLPKAREAERK